MDENYLNNFFQGAELHFIEDPFSNSFYRPQKCVLINTLVVFFVKADCFYRQKRSTGNFSE